MEIEYFISEADYIKCSKLAVTSTRKQLVWLSAGGSVLLLLGLFGPEPIKEMGYSGLLFGMLGYFASLYLIVPWQAKRHYRNYKTIQKPLSITMIDDGYTIRNESGHANIKWENLLKWRENKGFVLVFFAPKLFHIIPKRIVELGFDLDTFRKLLTEKLGEPI